MNGRGGESSSAPPTRRCATFPRGRSSSSSRCRPSCSGRVVDDCVAVGVKAVVAVTAMLGEMGAEGKVREQVAVAHLRDAGALRLGPNCLGSPTRPAGDACRRSSTSYRARGADLAERRLRQGLNLRRAEFISGFRVRRYRRSGRHRQPTVLRSFVGHVPRARSSSTPRSCATVASSRAPRTSSVASGTPVVSLAPGRSAPARASHAPHGVTDIRLGRRRCRMSRGRCGARRHQREAL